MHDASQPSPIRHATGTAPAPPPRILSSHVRTLGAPAPQPTASHPRPFPDLAALAERTNTSLARPTESLPVLEAFQTFLDAERDRMRQSVRRLTLLFTTILLIVGGLSMALGLVFYTRIKNDAAISQKTLEQLQNRLATISTDTSTLNRLTDDAATLRGTLDRHQSSLTKAATLVTSHDSELGTMKQTIATQEAEILTLRRALFGMQSKWGELDNAVAKALQTAEAAREAVSAPVREAPLTAPASPVDKHTTLALHITPRGKTRAVAWRLPIPE